MRKLSLLLIVTAAAAGAQTDRPARFMDNCRDNRGSDAERFCEVRNYSLAAGRSLAIDGRANGGISVHGWDRGDVSVVAMVQASAESMADAQAIARQVNVSANGASIRADGPSVGRRESWSVSYDVYVPRATELALTAHNGGISVESIAAHIEAETENGGLTLNDVHGDVHGRTVNGGINAELTGDRWIGNGLDLRTSNGGVHLTIPPNYSANLETGTVNGSMNVDMPITVQGRVGRELTTTLGSGGATIRATTTNGRVTIRRR
jgi:hypothetical protein